MHSSFIGIIFRKQMGLHILIPIIAFYNFLTIISYSSPPLMIRRFTISGNKILNIPRKLIARYSVSNLCRIPDHVAIGFTPQHTKQIYTLLKRIILLIVLLIIQFMTNRINFIGTQYISYYYYCIIANLLHPYRYLLSLQSQHLK